MSSHPEPSPLSPRATEIVTAARALLEEQGPDSLTMRALAERLGIRAPSLYKHLPDKAAVEVALIERGLAELGQALHTAVTTPAGPSADSQEASTCPSPTDPSSATPVTAALEPIAAAPDFPAQTLTADVPTDEGPPSSPIETLLSAYRHHALANPALYRLATSGPLPRKRLAPGLEEWAGSPFFLAVGEPHLAQALWSFAHGMVILELDGRYPEGSDLDRTWAEGARAFSPGRP
ncbi:WHG domain-containing protein [Sinosporangium album]|uniref:WHG domain-containing protein n=1 Tax=Sinosporangium album TaxID=504805 RepID=A0A1G8ICV7_9ACTN|nr:TetR/AcrR family transcriptional regulator [Sinosporangium album]SDI16390.1 WHG domain-containing protein [Sinosporangium album]